MAEEIIAQYKDVVREPRGGDYATDTEDDDTVRLMVVMERKKAAAQIYYSTGSSKLEQRHERN